MKVHMVGFVCASDRTSVYVDQHSHIPGETVINGCQGTVQLIDYLQRVTSSLETLLGKQ